MRWHCASSTAWSRGKHHHDDFSSATLKADDRQPRNQTNTTTTSTPKTENDDGKSDEDYIRIATSISKNAQETYVQSSHVLKKHNAGLLK